MGFFDELKKEISQAVTELVGDEELLSEEYAQTDATANEEEPKMEYLDEDDYIETHEDFVEEPNHDMGLVVDDYASDEYVNTLDIDIADLVKSYADELHHDEDFSFAKAQQQIEEDGSNNFDIVENDDAYGYGNQANVDEFDTNDVFSNDMSDDDVMVNTLDVEDVDASVEDVDATVGDADVIDAAAIDAEDESIENSNDNDTADIFKVTDTENWSDSDVVEEDIHEQTVEIIEDDVEVSHIEETVIEKKAVEEEVEVVTEAEPENEPEEKLMEEPVEESIEDMVVEQVDAVVEEINEQEPVEDVTIEQEDNSKALSGQSVDDLPEYKDVEIPVAMTAKVDSQLEEKMPEDNSKSIDEMKIPTMSEDEVVSQAFEHIGELGEPVDETAVITKGLTVKGDMEAEGSINIFGTVEGNIKCNGKLMVSGNIYGSSETGELFANNAHINGDILSHGSVKIGQGSVIIGNVVGLSAVIAGAVKGNIDVKGPVVVDSSAIVMGDIKSKSVQINIGAAIEGRCSQCYADVNPTEFFKEK